MQNIFNGAAENESLAAWNVTGITANSQGLNLWETGSFTVANYSATLVGWAAEAVKAGVTASVTNTFYNQAGLTAENTLVSNKTWVIAGDSAYAIATALTSSGATTTIGSTITFTATVTGTNPPNVAPTVAAAQSMWAITGTAGATSCTTVTGPSTAALVSTYTCTITVNKAGTYIAVYTYPGIRITLL